MMTDQKDIDRYFMSRAMEEAKRAFEAGEVPVGAVVVAKGKIIAKGHNQTVQLNDPTAHAEMLALTAAANYLQSRYLEACTLYVTLEPCGMCAGAAFWSQLGRLVYGASDPKRGYARHQPSMLPAKMEVKTGVLAEECQEILDTFFWTLRNS